MDVWTMPGRFISGFSDFILFHAVKFPVESCAVVGVIKSKEVVHYKSVDH